MKHHTRTARTAFLLYWSAQCKAIFYWWVSGKWAHAFSPTRQHPAAAVATHFSTRETVDINSASSLSCSVKEPIPLSITCGNETTTKVHVDKDNKQEKQNHKHRPRISILSYYPRFAAVNKPSGMTMHAGGRRDQRRHGTLKSILKKQLARKIFPIHRLDHGTSG